MTLIEAIKRNGGGMTDSLIKWLGVAGINDWNDLTKSRLLDLRDTLVDNVASGSAKTYLAALKCIIGRYEEDIDIPCKSYRDFLKVKADKPMKTSLTPEELERLERVPTLGKNEEYVLKCFLVGAKTGMRHSDILRTTPENILGTNLSYVSQKTSTATTIPVSEKTKGYIDYICKNVVNISLVSYNNIVRRLAERAGIVDKVKVHIGGKDKVSRKCDCISSHTARISFCTNLYNIGVPLLDISRLAGHSDIKMTTRYIVNMGVNLSPEALQLLM